jgi:hypothetical protein
VLLLGLLLLPAAAHARDATWAQEALQKEADYIVNCSFTELARHHEEAQPSDDAYGALNVNRIYQRGPDWVSPGEAAMGAIGLMAAARQLKTAGIDIAGYDQVLERFFRTWLLERKQPFSTDESSVENGGAFQRIYYDATGKRKNQGPARTGVTGQLIAAMWKFYEYRKAIGSEQTADEWLKQAWPLAKLGGDFLQANYEASYRLMRSNGHSRDLWVSDSAYAAAAFRCLDRWAAAVGEKQPIVYGSLADDLAQGIRALKDNGARKGFFRYRDARRHFRPTYGDRIDQNCFLPYEADVLDPGEKFARAISDWWTNGSGGIRMTHVASSPSDWRYYGTHWHYYFRPTGKAKAEHKNLYPGPGLQLAKVEWKHGKKAGDPVALERARRRLQWAAGKSFSNLWLGVNGIVEAEVPAGLVDWRDSTNYQHKADDWARFVDTSAYFIEALLMLYYGVDTKYVPS